MKPPTLSSSRAAARSLARRRQRGTAMVEAAAILPVFVVLWFAVVYAHNVADAKMRMVAGSRAIAWAYAMGNCGNQGDPNPTPTPQIAGKKVDPMLAAPGVGSMLGSGGGGFMSAITGVVSNAVSSAVPLAQDFDSQWTMNQPVSFRMPNNYNGNPGVGVHTVTGLVTVSCNEAPLDGNLTGILKMVWNAVKPW
jgi:Flp pilus assembly protein TadG